MLVYQTNPVGVQLFPYVNTFFFSNKFAWLLKQRECIRPKATFNISFASLKSHDGNGNGNVTEQKI